MLLALLTLVGEWHGRCYGCLEEERIGLLEIHSLIDPDGFSLEIGWTVVIVVSGLGSSVITLQGE